MTNKIKKMARRKIADVTLIVTIEVIFSGCGLRGWFPDHPLHSGDENILPAIRQYRNALRSPSHVTCLK